MDIGAELTIKFTDFLAALRAVAEYLNSVEFYQLSLAIGVHVCAVIFSAFAVIMIALLIVNDSPRPKRHFLWTWIVVSLAFFLVRAVVIFRLGDDGRIFIFAMAWWNLTISGAVALVVYAGQALATLAGGRTFEDD